MNLKHVEEQIELLRDYVPLKSTCDRAADTMQALLDVARAADKCKNGCRRCESFERYPNLRDALAKLQEQNDEN